jgi:hypothetical protein
MKIIVGTQYFGNIEYFTHINQADEVLIEINDHYEKQSFRNRTTILGANGPLNLVVPLLRRGIRMPTKNVTIEYAHNWDHMHWRSLESAYRSSPYFEFYEHHFEPFYTQKFKGLVELNQAIFEKMVKLLNITTPYSYTTEYNKTVEDYVDLRPISKPQQALSKHLPETPYIQVFEHLNGFVPNLSIFDLLCSEGPRSKDFL